MKHWKYYLGSAALLISFCLNFHYAYKGYGISGNGSFSRMHAAIWDDSDSFPLPDDSDSFPLPDDSDSAESCNGDETDENGKIPCYARLEMQETLMWCTVYYYEIREQNGYLVDSGKSLSELIWNKMYDYPDTYLDVGGIKRKYIKTTKISYENASATEWVCFRDGKAGSCTPIDPACDDDLAS